MRRTRQSAFTLVELLVVIGIIAVLVGILLPALGRARESANATKCAANLRSIGQGFAIYVADNKQTFPAAYIYNGMQISNGSQTPDQATYGYVHWSSYIYGTKNKDATPRNNQSAAGVTLFEDSSSWQAFQCPSIPEGGLPPTNPAPSMTRISGVQVDSDDAGVVDYQAPRLAYTVNEAICPRNKFVLGFQSAQRTYQFVKAGQIRGSATTILAAEWNQNWQVVAGPPRSGGTGGGNDTVCKSHRPVHGFRGLAGGLNVDEIPPAGQFNQNQGAAIIRATAADLMKDPKYPDITASKTRLDWIGRNHYKKLDNGGYNIGKTNFLYVDGHVETKSVKETISPWQWGEQFYSLVQKNDVARN